MYQKFTKTNGAEENFACDKNKFKHFLSFWNNMSIFVKCSQTIWILPEQYMCNGSTM